MKFHLQLLFLGLFLSAFSLVLCNSANAQGGIPPRKVVDSSPQEYDFFGEALAANDDWLFATELSSVENQGSEGVVFVFRREPVGWVMHQELLLGPCSTSQFWLTRIGTDMDIDGDQAVITNINGHNSLGQVFVLELLGGQWTCTQEILCPQPSATDNFGCSVGISGNTLMIGARRNATRANYGGAVFIYEEQAGGWTHVQTFYGYDPGVFDFDTLLSSNVYPALYEFRYVGGALDVDGELAVVSNERRANNMLPAREGRVFVLERVGGVWRQKQILRHPSPDYWHSFGQVSLTIHEGQILVGVGGVADGPSSIQPGSVCVFHPTQTGNGEFSFHQEIEGSRAYVGSYSTGGNFSDGFGEAVAASGSRAVIGAPRGRGDSAPNSTAGEAYVFERDSQGYWWEQARVDLANDDPFQVGHFGESVAINDWAVFVGQRTETSPNGVPGAGAVYVYEKDYADLVCTQPANATGLPGRVRVQGHPDPAVNGLTAYCDHLFPNSVVLLFASQSTGAIDLPSTIQGDLCIGGALARIGVGVADGLGVAALPIDSQAVPLTPAQPILVGQTWYFQAVYRETLIGSNSYASEGVAVTF